MKPVLRYFGSKFKVAGKIIPVMGPHTVYCEPFGGSGGVMLNKYPVPIEIYNELHPRIFNLMCVLKSRDQVEELCHRVDRAAWCRENWDQAYTRVPDPVEDAVNVLIRSWMSFSPVGIFRDNSGYRTGAYDRDNLLNGHQKIWRKLPRRIRRVHERVKRWEMSRSQAIETLERVDRRFGSAVLYYVDPPYLHSTRVAKQGYGNEMSIEDHASLLTALQRVRGRVLLSGYRNSLYETILSTPDWFIHEYRSCAAGKKGGVGREEVLWTNYHPVELPTQTDLFSFNHHVLQEMAL